MSEQRASNPRDIYPESCRCHDDVGLNPRCPVHGNHPSNIKPEIDPGECDNTRGDARSDDDV